MEADCLGKALAERDTRTTLRTTFETRNKKLILDSALHFGEVIVPCSNPISTSCSLFSDDATNGGHLPADSFQKDIGL